MPKKRSRREWRVLATQVYAYAMDGWQARAVYVDIQAEARVASFPSHGDAGSRPRSAMPAQ